MKKILAILMTVLVMAALLCACGEKSGEATPDEAAKIETTVVLETTADGGTVEKDPEGNIVTKDQDGNVTAVEDKDGNPLDVKEYLETHSYVQGSGSSSDSSGSSSGSSGSSDSSGKSGDSSDSQDETEGEIPVIIATIPDDEDLIELPDL